MDKFKRQSFKQIGPGGVKCPCCNDGYFGKERKGLNRLARTRLKAKDYKDNIDLANEIQEDIQAEQDEREAEEEARLYYEEIMFWENLTKEETIYENSMHIRHPWST